MSIPNKHQPQTFPHEIVKIPSSFQGWRVFGCPKSTFDLVAKVEEDIKELEADQITREVFFRWGEMRC